MLHSGVTRVYLSVSVLASGRYSRYHRRAGKSWLGISAWNRCASTWSRTVPELIHWPVRDGEAVESGRARRPQRFPGRETPGAIAQKNQVQFVSAQACIAGPNFVKVPGEGEPTHSG